MALGVTAADLVIVDLADEVAELRDRGMMTDTYREMAQLAIAELAEGRTEIERLRRRVAALCEENRRHQCAEGS